MNLDAVPVLMYHSVKFKRKDSWIHKHLSLELDEFNRHLNFISLLKLKTFFIDDLEQHLKGNRKLPMNSLLLTFDDGYLDNYSFVFPLLKKYKIKATIWVNPDFVDFKSNELRPTLEDYWSGKISLEELNNFDGFLNWGEMRLMEKSGLVDIQSHTMTHTKYPISDNIIDFVNPGTRIDWLYWNLFPEDKPNFLTKPQFRIPFGYPIYESAKGNIARKYEENGTLTKNLIDYVTKSGGEKFFEESAWKEKLFQLSTDIKRNCNVIYKQESEEEYETRIRYELSESKRIIEHNLNKKIEHVCWPFGGWDEKTLRIANEIGYKTTTAKGEKNMMNKTKSSRVDRIAFDNLKYQNILFYPYSLFKIIKYKSF